MRFALPLLLASTLAAPAFADAHVGPRVTGALVDADGTQIGSVSIFETASGIVRVNVQAIGQTPGAHGVHLHETGECEGDFTSAGGHIAGDAMHGLVEGGNHPGDLPNAFVGEDGELSMEAFKANLSVDEHLIDADGAALIIHSGPDDYESQPAGDAGSRVACAVLEEAG
ncbi:superoxide dismutase family protein [Jannaschia ovalis]|uniref:Superoxide dismutase family protein n=1 Tax=Jannaschia ovalis TaxID=3038773 RepID=A0ABY8LA52_9RHOB|nr:superoxide dismutase family protein [Jannaschia sp. GRR-S6-38]WGH78186.1 superoxide dismutase family protein [Jannaschia sp. GRR-S6-38]